MDAFLLTRDLLFTSQIAAAATRHGAALRTATGVTELLALVDVNRGYLVIIDLSTAELDIAAATRELQAATNAPTAILAFGPHVHAARLDAARRAGCDRVVTRGQFARDMDQLLGQYLTA